MSFMGGNEKLNERGDADNGDVVRAPTLLDIPDDANERTQGALYREVRPTGEKRYELRKQIGGLTYIFVLFETWDNLYKISFKTEEHDYAITQGSTEDIEQIFQTLKQVVDVARGDNPAITKIIIEPATHEYSVEEIEECKELILHRDPSWTRERLDQLEGFEVLRKYEEYEGNEDFRLKRGQHVVAERKQRSPFELRARLFRIYFKKYFPEWDIEQDEWGGNNFNLVFRETP